jgi:hypothetical protein
MDGALIAWSGSGRHARSRLTASVIALALVALCATAGGQASAASGSTAATGGIERLDHPGRTSYWAFVDFATTARTRPNRTAKRVARLGTKTEDRTDNLVLVLARTVRRGRTWLQVRLPILPNNSVGWVPANDLSSLHAVHTWLKVDRAHEKLTLIRRGRTVFTARVGVGTPSAPTPAGNFYVRDELTGFPPGTIYGALAFGTSAKSAVLTDWPRGGVIGIHGTNQPELIPGHVSHGCVRMRNPDIKRLARMLPIGTPLTIR